MMRSLMIAAALLLPTACLAETHCVSSRTTSPVGIEQTLLSLATGAASGAAGSAGAGGGVDIKKVIAAAKAAKVTVYVDCVSRDVLVITRWRQMNASIEAFKAEMSADSLETAIGDVVEFLAAGQTVIEIVQKAKQFIDDAGHVPGSFGYRYSFTYGRSTVVRKTFVEDNHLKLTTCVCGGIPLMDSATLVIDATEFGGGTDIASTLTVRTPFGRLPLVKRIIQRQLSKILKDVESKAHEIGRGGESTVIGAANAFVTIISPRGGQ